MKIVLASASPRRKDLLAIITPNFDVVPSEVDESNITAETPVELVKKLSLAKCMDVHKTHNNDIVIGADTIVEIDGEVLGKPTDETDAISMLKKLEGKAHLVHTGVTVAKVDRIETIVQTTKVYFTQIPHSELLAYVKTDEPYDKAGGYGIQSWAAKYISGVEGCFFNVWGFPVAAVYEMLKKLGVNL